MEQTRLIFLEGIPGSGKSTMARRVHEWLAGRGMDASLYLEGDANHPVNLAWHAYFPMDEYRRFEESHPGLSEYAVIEEEYALVRYRDVNGHYFDGDARKLLEDREFCFGARPAVSLESFTSIVSGRWERFAQRADGVSVFDASFLQHPVHDLLRNYHTDEDQIYDHVASALERVEPLHPVLFYIAQYRVEDSLRRIAELRAMTKFAQEDSIRFWRRRKTIEFSLMSRLPLRTYVIDNSDYDWEKVFGIITGILN